MAIMILNEEIPVSRAQKFKYTLKMAQEYVMVGSRNKENISLL